MASTGRLHTRYSVKANTSSAAAPWTKPDSSVSTPQELPSKADSPAATSSAKSAAPGLRMISGATSAGISQAPYSTFWTGPTNSTARQTAPNAQKPTPNATPMTAAMTMSLVRQRVSGPATAGPWTVVAMVPNLLVNGAQPPTAGTASTSRRACFLRRYEPDQVPRVCGACHTLSARGAPRRRCSVVPRC